ANIDAGQAGKKTVPGLQYVLLPLLTTNSQGLNSLDDEVADDAIKKSTKVPRKENGVKDLVKKKGKQHKASWNQTNGKAGTKANIDAGQAGKKTVPGLQYVLLPLLTTNSQGLNSLDDEVADDAIKKSTKVPRKENGVKDLVKKVTK
nr:hypothetical protein [Tanacetum cinerariifolium]